MDVQTSHTTSGMCITHAVRQTELSATWRTATKGREAHHE
jgi:hypothetical protein